MLDNTQSDKLFPITSLPANNRSRVAFVIEQNVRVTSMNNERMLIAFALLVGGVGVCALVILYLLR
jgi:hypothetical protein